MRNFVQLENLIIPLNVTSVQDVGGLMVLIEVADVDNNFEGAFVRKFSDRESVDRFVAQCQSTFSI